MATVVGDRTPVAIVTGFLGSGKTTLLARFVHETGLARTAFIVNEFGEIGLDRALVTRGREDGAVLLDSGCLCCALNGSIEETLESLYYQRVRGDIAPFERVVIETTGLADPAPIAAAIGANSTVARRFRLAGILTTVDAVHGANSLAQFEEARLQVALADILAFTKSDAAAATTAAEARDSARALNTHARTTVITRGIGARSVLLALLEPGKPDEAVDRPPAPSSPATCAHEPTHEHDDPSHDGGHIAKHGFSSCAVRLSQPPSLAQYFAWSALVQRELGSRLLRAKGIIALRADSDDGKDIRFHSIQAVRHLFDRPAPLDWAPGEQSANVLVLIARDASKTELEKLVQALQPAVRGSAH